MAPHEDIFNRLQNRANISALLGTTEDLYLDCKQWPAKEEDARRILAKALSGFANADGGVIVIGMGTVQKSKGDPDVITDELPVADAVAVKARIENLLGDLVEPLMPGVRIAAVLDKPGSSAGFVLVDVPPTDGFPVRSRKEKQFYLRIGSGTYPMEYYQLADMFGRRRRPSLALYLEEIQTGALLGARGVVEIKRTMMLGLRNEGRGIARFPSIRVRPNGPLFVDDELGVNGNGSFGLNRLTADANVIAFGGGVDHVIHAGTILKITKLLQRGTRAEWKPPVLTGEQLYVFGALNITIDMFADGVESKTATIQLPEAEFSL